MLWRQEKPSKKHIVLICHVTTAQIDSHNKKCNICHPHFPGVDFSEAVEGGIEYRHVKCAWWGIQLMRHSTIFSKWKNIIRKGRKCSYWKRYFHECVFIHNCWFIYTSFKLLPKMWDMFNSSPFPCLLFDYQKKKKKKKKRLQEWNSHCKRTYQKLLDSVSCFRHKKIHHLTDMLRHSYSRQKSQRMYQLK